MGRALRGGGGVSSGSGSTWRRAHAGGTCPPLTRGHGGQRADPLPGVRPSSAPLTSSPPLQRGSRQSLCPRAARRLRSRRRPRLWPHGAPAGSAAPVWVSARRPGRPCEAREQGGGAPSLKVLKAIGRDFDDSTNMDCGPKHSVCKAAFPKVREYFRKEPRV